jgi:hypothetical protein
MARPKKESGEHMTANNPENQYYDKVLCAVHRERSGKWPVTKSVSVVKIERKNMPNSEVTLTALNNSQDWQNPSSDGVPMVLWWFPAGLVKIGDEYKANDVQKYMIDEEDEEKEIKMYKHDGSPDLAYMVVHTDKKIKEWIPSKNGQSQRGKPVYFDSKVSDSE